MPVADAGLNVAVTPLGRAARREGHAAGEATRAAMAMVLAPLAPWVTVRLDGLADNVKFGVAAALTVKLTVVVRVRPPPVPVTVTLAVPVAAVAVAASVRVLLAPVVEARAERGGHAVRRGARRGGHAAGEATRARDGDGARSAGALGDGQARRAGRQRVSSAWRGVDGQAHGGGPGEAAAGTGRSRSRCRSRRPSRPA